MYSFLFLKFFEFFKTFVGRFLIGEHISIWMSPSVLSHHALGTVECDESYCNDGGTIFGRRGCGEFFYHES